MLQLHPDLSLPKKTHEDILLLIKPLYNKSLAYQKKRDVDGFLELLPGELKRLANIEKTNAIVKVNTDKNLQMYIYGENWDKSFPEYSKDLKYGFAAIFEYLLAEILELTGNVTRDESKKNITYSHIIKAIKNDEELKKLFRV